MFYFSIITKGEALYNLQEVADNAILSPEEIGTVTQKQNLQLHISIKPVLAQAV